MGKIKRTLISVGIFFVAQIVVTLIFVIAGMAQGMDISTAVNSTLGPALLISDLLVIVILLSIKFCRFKELFKRVPVNVLLFSIAFALCGMFAVELLSSCFDIPNMLEEQFKALTGTVSGFLGICIIGPVMEEMIMRRVILKEMKKATKSMWWGIIISSALFAIIHFNPIQVVFAMPAGIFLGWLYCKTSSLLVPICVHILNNTISFITMSIGSDTEIGLNSTLGKILFVAFILVSAVSCFWIVKYYSKHPQEQELQETADEAEPESKGDSSAGQLVE